MDASEREARWERECAAAVLAGLQVCPVNRMPCWTCTLLSNLFAIFRGVTLRGRFEIAAMVPWDSLIWDDPALVCIHRWEQLQREHQRRTP